MTTKPYYSYYTYSLNHFFCHFGLVPFTIRFEAQKMSSSSILESFACGDSDGVWALCTSFFFASMCCEFLTCLGDLLAFSEFTYSSIESSFIRPLYQISFVEHGHFWMVDTQREKPRNPTLRVIGCVDGWSKGIKQCRYIFFNDTYLQ